MTREESATYYNVFIAGAKYIQEKLLKK